MARGLTSLQAQTLACIKDNGPCPASEVSRHLLVTDSSARSALAALERRNYVARQYTGTVYNAACFVITGDGEDAYEREFGDDDDDA